MPELWIHMESVVFMSLYDFLKLKVKQVTDPPALMDEEINEEQRNTNHFESIYPYVLFADSDNRDIVVGRRKEFMRDDYTVDSAWYSNGQYIHKLWRLSKDLDSTKITNPKKYFETIEELERLLEEAEKYKIKFFFPDKERELWFGRKSELIIAFLDRSFKDEFRSALELKTPKGRIDRIDHWFMVLKYYRSYMTEAAQKHLDELYCKWLSEFRAIAEK